MQHTYRDQLLEPAPLRDVLRQPELLPLEERAGLAVCVFCHSTVIIINGYKCVMWFGLKKSMFLASVPSRSHVVALVYSQVRFHDIQG